LMYDLCFSARNLVSSKAVSGPSGAFFVPPLRS